MDWQKDNRYTNTFTCSNTFNGYKYVVEIWVEDKVKTLKFWVALSSGKKRKELSIFEDKPKKSLGGIRALLWAKRAIFSFPKYYNKGWHTEETKMFICIRWADGRRRDIYERLEKDGFKFMTIEGKKTLIKEIRL